MKKLELKKEIREMFNNINIQELTTQDLGWFQLFNKLVPKMDNNDVTKEDLVNLHYYLNNWVSKK